MGVGRVAGAKSSCPEIVERLPPRRFQGTLTALALPRPPIAVPEPSTLLSAALGLAGLAGYAGWLGGHFPAEPPERLHRGKVMDLNTVLAEVQSWPAEDRLRLIEEVWGGLSDEASEFELTEELKDLLDRRLAALDAAPGNVLTWDEVKAYVRRPR